jgi:polar amino acid transport system permease protein
MGVYLKGFLIACKGIPATVAVSLIAIVIGAAFGLLLALCSKKNKIFIKNKTTNNI